MIKKNISLYYFSRQIVCTMRSLFILFFRYKRRARVSCPGINFPLGKNNPVSLTSNRSIALVKEVMNLKVMNYRDNKLKVNPKLQMKTKNKIAHSNLVA